MFVLTADELISLCESQEVTAAVKECSEVVTPVSDVVRCPPPPKRARYSVVAETKIRPLMDLEFVDLMVHRRR
jgi:hypothetical protein